MKLYLYYWQYGLVGMVIAKNCKEADQILWEHCPMARPMLDNPKHYGRLNNFCVEEIEIASGNFKCFI